MKKVFVSSGTLGGTALSVDMDSGTIFIDREKWKFFNEFQKKFYLLHEEGHYILQTDCQKEADLYALKKIAGTTKKSLSKAVHAIEAVVSDQDRLEALYKEALKIDYALGNVNAMHELEKFSKTQKIRKMDEINDELVNATIDDDGVIYDEEGNEIPRRDIIDIVDPVFKNKRTNDDGSEMLQRGIKIGNYYFTILETLILGFLLLKIFRKTK